MKGTAKEKAVLGTRDGQAPEAGVKLRPKYAAGDLGWRQCEVSLQGAGLVFCRQQKASTGLLKGMLTLVLAHDEAFHEGGRVWKQARVWEGVPGICK